MREKSREIRLRDVYSNVVDIIVKYVGNCSQ